LNRKSPHAHKVIIGALGVAIVLPFLISPASAAFDSGTFLVHAQDQAQPKFHEAYAGIKGTKSGDTGGTPGTPGGDTGDSSATLATYTAGSLSLKITQAMLDFSAANVKAQEEGRTEDIKTDPSGWQTIWFYDNDSGDATQSMPAADASSIDMIFSRESTKPSPDSLYNRISNNMVAQYNQSPGSNSMTDGRVAPKADNLYAYKKAASGYSNELKEGRYISEDGKLVAVEVDGTGDGNYQINRKTSPTDATPVPSDTKPYDLILSNRGVESLSIRLKATTDGYDQLWIQGNGTQIRFGKYASVGPYGINVDDAVRRHGPVSLNLDGDGNITSFLYADADGQNQYVGDEGATYTVADYNSITGQDWDGSYPKLSDFDTDKPFEPKG